MTSLSYIITVKSQELYIGIRENDFKVSIIIVYSKLEIGSKTHCMARILLYLQPFTRQATRTRCSALYKTLQLLLSRTHQFSISRETSGHIVVYAGPCEGHIELLKSNRINQLERDTNGPITRAQPGLRNYLEKHATPTGNTFSGNLQHGKHGAARHTHTRRQKPPTNPYQYNYLPSIIFTSPRSFVRGYMRYEYVY